MHRVEGPLADSPRARRLVHTQRSYLDTLAREAGETLPADLTKAEASQHIERLQSQTGRSDS